MATHPTPARRSLLTAALRGLALLGKRDVWAVGSTYQPRLSADAVEQALAEPWDGASWRVVPLPNHPGSGLNAAAVAANGIWAVGHVHSAAGPTSLILRYLPAACVATASPTPMIP